jgi:hypothetical protein
VRSGISFRANSQIRAVRSEPIIYGIIVHMSTKVGHHNMTLKRMFRTEKLENLLGSPSDIAISSIRVNRNYFCGDHYSPKKDKIKIPATMQHATRLAVCFIVAGILFFSGNCINRHDVTIAPNESSCIHVYMYSLSSALQAHFIIPTDLPLPFPPLFHPKL